MSAAPAAIATAPEGASSPTLPYADLPSRWGICVERNEDGVRVVVPPVPDWRRLSAGFFVGGAILAFVLLSMVVPAMYWHEWLPVLPSLAVYGGGLLWVVLAARHRLRRRIVLEVSGRAVSATQTSGGRAGRRREWPRAGVSEIKLNPGNGKLIIRVTGVAFVELYLGPDRALNAHVADTLAAALREPLRALPASGAESSQIAPPAHPPTHDGVRSRALRRVLLAASLVMAAAGALLTFLPLPLPARPMGFYLLLFSAAPAGVALGTQDKEFYV
jgi:hypothetical protein